MIPFARPITAACALLAAAASMGVDPAVNAPAPPVARIEPHTLEAHGHVRTDDYFWLRERESPEVVAYLEAENDYTKAVMADTEALQETLVEEIKGRIKQTDLSVPYKLQDYYYYVRYEEGKDYPIHCRKRGSLEAPEEIMLDVNVMAEGHAYYAVGRVAVSSGQDRIAYAVDTEGRRKYTVYVKDLATGELLADVLPDVTGNMSWANDNKTLFYTKQDPETLRWNQVWRHTLGADPAMDVLVYEEDDETFGVGVGKTKSREYLVIACYQTVSTEYRILDADTPGAEWRVFLPRERDHEYSVDHAGDWFYIRTNADGAKNFKLMRAPVSDFSRARWEDVLPHRDDVFFEGAQLFDDYLVAEERKDGLIQMRVRPWDGSPEHYIDFGEPAYAAGFGANHDFDTTVLRYGYTSLTTPSSVYDYDMAARTKTLLKREEVLGDFDSAEYVTERLHATAADGARIPISVVYRKGLEKNGANPFLLYGYGSYGHSLDAAFSSSRLSLLDRGFVYAIAHVRGGQELGRDWYDQGRLLNKKNTFTDFIACAEHVIAEGYTSPGHLYCSGGSAGGLLVGAVLNMRPDLFHGAVANVPFVDIVTTMLDDSIPLTTGEYDEWGNPHDKTYYDYMLSYSPYDNVRAQAYPHILIETGLHDSQVQYWEPAKWLAKLRTMKTDGNFLIMKTDMEAGHSGGTGRTKRYKELAFEYAFLLKLAGKTQ